MTMKKRITFRMHAFSDAAGKYNPDAVRGGNEDNFYVDDNLCDEILGHCESDMTTELCDLGLIMAVADGMGGMNAGEVASEIAVNTIQDFFAPGKVTDKIAKDHQSRKQYLEKLIIEADNRIKKDAKQNPEHEGMGSTIILAWIVGGEMTLSWVGDSRAYRFNPATGIELISEDHSYVQELVQQGLITYDQTFEHPQGNIITRSLGDTSKRIQPETRFFNIYNNDIILLCSDGLSGVLRDRKTPDGEGGYFPGDNLEDLIRENSATLVGCREALWQAAEKADWYDNVTAILCEIQSGAGKAPERLANKNNPIKPEKRPFWSRTVAHLTPKSLVITIVTLLVVIAAIYFSMRWIKDRQFEKDRPNIPATYKISAIVNDEKGGDVSGGGIIDEGNTCTLTATKHTGYTFVNWTLNDEEVSDELEYSFEVKENAEYTANFILNSYEITATANPNKGGLIEGTGKYNHFQTCKLIATANSGYTFVNWTLDGKIVSSETTISFEVSSPSSYIANFKIATTAHHSIGAEEEAAKEKDELFPVLTTDTLEVFRCEEINTTFSVSVSTYKSQFRSGFNHLLVLNDDYNTEITNYLLPNTKYYLLATRNAESFKQFKKIVLDNGISIKTKNGNESIDTRRDGSMVDLFAKLNKSTTYIVLKK